MKCHKIEICKVKKPILNYLEMSVGQGFIDAASIFLSGYRNLIHKYQRVQFTLVFHS